MRGATDMSYVVGNWEGKYDLPVVPVDGFDIILGMDF